MEVTNKALFERSPEDGVIWAYCAYTRNQGLEMLAQKFCFRRSDTADSYHRKFSLDNGRTWTEWAPLEGIRTQTAEGMHRTDASIGVADPGSKRYVSMVNDGVLPTDNPGEGFFHWRLRYRVSLDGGRSDAVDQPVVQSGPYTEANPLQGVEVGNGSGFDITHVDEDNVVDCTSALTHRRFAAVQTALQPSIAVRALQRCQELSQRWTELDEGLKSGQLPDGMSVNEAERELRLTESRLSSQEDRISNMIHIYNLLGIGSL